MPDLALFPGSFDPPTRGHLDLIERGLALFDEIEVVVAVNAHKQSLFSADERCALIRACTAHLDRVHVAVYEGLLVDYARQRGAVALLRGIRQATDFDYEMRMAYANRRLHPALETVFLAPAEAHALVSASLVREIHRWGGDVRSFVPDPVHQALQQKT